MPTTERPNFMHVRRIILCLAVACLWATHVPNLAFGQSPALTEESDFGSVGGVVVGEFGDPGRLAVEGTETFTDKQLIDSLMENPDFLIASHTAAPLAEYLQTIRKLLLSGYQDNGFPRVEVTTSANRSTGRVVVKVAEGSRYVIGGVNVLGAKTIPVDQLILQLTELSPSLDFETPAFQFDNDALKSSAVSVGPEQPSSPGKIVEPEPQSGRKVDQHDSPRSR
jgi:hypothetical protein